MLKHGKISMGLLTTEAELEEDRPRRGFRDMLRHPRWRTICLTAVLFVVALLTMNSEITRNNIGWLKKTAQVAGKWPESWCLKSRPAL